jgi:ectoine hydroxylase-related dioxygenase (phytanoyl-CoA dioxygenase family)
MWGYKTGQFLSDEQVAHFRKDGFLAIDVPVADPAEVALIKRSLTDLFSRRAGWEEGAQYDHVGINDDRDSDQSMPQMIDPSAYATSLRRLKYRKQALAIAQQLLGPTAFESFEHALLKPALVGPETPWHQDEAYRVDPAFEYQQLSIWLPTDDVHADNGCMKYIPLSRHPDLLEHAPLHGDSRRHALECTDNFDPNDAVFCPIPAGGIAIHSGLTLHSAGANTTNLPRYAYVLGFETPPVLNVELSKRAFPWQSTRSTANWMRRRAWMMRGGFFKLLVRKARRSGNFGPRHVWQLLLRGFRYVVRIVWRPHVNPPAPTPTATRTDGRPS